jgi:uncharacterized protein YdaU (DUF1376 family)
MARKIINSNVRKIDSFSLEEWKSVDVWLDEFSSIMKADTGITSPVNS